MCAAIHPTSLCFKDALQGHYEKEGSFPGSTIKPKRRVWTLLNFLFWATLLLSPLINFAWDVFVSGSPLLIIGFMIFLIVGQSLFYSCALIVVWSFCSLFIKTQWIVDYKGYLSKSVSVEICVVVYILK